MSKLERKEMSAVVSILAHAGSSDTAKVIKASYKDVTSRV